jgi:hypothetical protein
MMCPKMYGSSSPAGARPATSTCFSLVFPYQMNA